MGEKTKISWTATVLSDGTVRAGKTQNDWWGCRKVSDECVNCYAETLARRTGRDIFGLGKPRWRTSEKNRREPLKWNAEAATLEGPVYVFAESMGDVWDNEIPIEWLVDLLDTVRRTDRLTWLLLTKRPGNWHPRMVDALECPSCSDDLMTWITDWLAGDAPPNVWIGWTAGTQRTFDERTPLGLSIPAVRHFVSMEPMLEAINAMHIDCDGRDLHPTWCQINPLTGCQTDMGRPCRDVPRIDWIIVGGESGARARPFDLAWARSIRDQCAKAGVAFFLKQTGSNHVDTVRREFRSFEHWVNKASTRVPEGAVLRDAVGRVCRVGADFMRARDEGTFPVGFTTTVQHLSIRGEGREPEEWPEDLRVQQWPEEGR